MNPPVAGLRPIFNRSNGVVKTSVVIPAGDVLHVSDEIAKQLVDGRNGMAEGEPPAKVEEATDTKGSRRKPKE